MVIGGGPSGMQAALTADSRGHQVILCEKEKALGGVLRYAAAPSFKTDMKRYLDWLIMQTTKSKVKVKLLTEATPDYIKKEKPDVIIAAIGAEPVIPNIPGIKGANVVLACDVDIGRVEIGKRAVVAGAGLVGCETALLLAQQGKDVVLIDMISKEDIAIDAGFQTQCRLIELLHQYKVDIKVEVKLEEINDTAVTIVDKNWRRYKIPADTVVLALGYQALIEQAQSFKGLANEIHVIGDCIRPGNLMSAIHSAFNTVIEI